MASISQTFFLLLSLTQLLFVLITNAQTPSAPAPGPAGPINLTDILSKGGQFTQFIRLLNQTQVSNQINSQLNNSNDGMTVFAPTDNAFQNLPAGTLNGLSIQQQVQLILYHVLPKYYSMSDLLTVSNPVRTQATGQDGGVFGLNFTGQANQVNVSTGIVETQINNFLRQQFPLAVYPVDKVLLPKEFTEAKAPGAAPPAKDTPSGGATGSGSTPAADEPTPAGNGSEKMKAGLGLVGLVWFFCIGVFM